MLAEKKCPSCCIVKSSQGYTKNRAQYGGLSTYCKPCDRSRRVDHRQRNRVRVRVWCKSNRQANPGTNNARAARHRAATLQAVPLWSDPVLVCAFYDEARRMTLDTGVLHSVDHVVPLQSKRVCGLHSQSNLQVIEGLANSVKSNRYWPDMF